jgi:hypothetical protein
MKSIVMALAALATLIASPTTAELKPGTQAYRFATEENPEDFCRMFAGFSEEVMFKRQIKMFSFEKTLSEIRKIGFDSRIEAILREVVFSAYETPLVQGLSATDARARLASIDDFRNRMHIRCLRENLAEG